MVPKIGEICAGSPEQQKGVDVSSGDLIAAGTFAGNLPKQQTVEACKIFSAHCCKRAYDS